MKGFPKRLFAAMIAGVLIGAVALAPFMIEAATDAPQRPAIEQRKIDPDKAAQYIAELFSIHKDTVLKMHEAGLSFKAITKAAYIATASGQSIDNIVEQKTAENTWKDVAESFNLTKEQIKSARQTVTANYFQRKLNLQPQTTLNLLQQGYHRKQIAFASKLADNTAKPIESVLALKTKDNTWQDVAHYLGVSDELLKKNKEELTELFPYQQFKHKRHHI